MGKVKLEGDGTYSVDFIKKVGGKRYHISKKGFSSELEANRAIPILIEKKLSTIRVVTAKGKFEQFFSSYLEHRSHKVGGSTLLAIKAVYNVLLVDYKEMEVSEVLSVHNVIHLYKEIIGRDGVGEKWKNRVIGELRIIVDYASLLKLISPEETNDDKAILESIPITKKSKERESYTLPQLKRFLNAIDDEEDKELLTIFAYLGARISEFVALTWDCYDRISRTIEIKQQILYLQKGKPILTDRLKTRESYRKCRLSMDIVDLLDQRKKRNGGNGYIFPKSSKTPHEPMPKSTIRKKMHHYMDKAKLPRISPHGFRHTKATMFMKVCRNMDEIKAAAKFMGHSVTMMMETYAHSEDKTIDVLVRRLEEK